jgi:hypothetical protein
MKTVTPSKLTRAKQPFRFFSRMALSIATGTQARDLPSLLGGIRAAPEPVIYEHTYGFLQRHRFLTPETTNDFAGWVAAVLREDRVGERLAAIDATRYRSIQELRESFVAILSRAIDETAPPYRTAPEGQEFHFMSAIRYSLPTTYEAWDLADLAKALGKIGAASLYLHVFESMLRHQEGRSDLSWWAEEELGESALARAIEALDPAGQSLEFLRARLIGTVDRRIADILRV